MFPARNSLENDLKLLFSRYLFLIVFCLLLNMVLTPLIRGETSFFYCLILELIYIFIAFISFGIMWVTYDRHPGLNLYIGFGLLAAALCDLAHIYTISEIQLYLGQNRFLGLSVWYMLLSKIILTISLLMGTINKDLKMTRRDGLLAYIIPTNLLICFIYLIHNSIPSFLTAQGLILSRILLIIILIILLLLLILRFKLYIQEWLIYRCVIIAVMLAISSEGCFIIYDGIQYPYAGAGYLLKAFSYCYLCKGIVLSGIIMPINQLEERQDSYNKIFECLPMGIIKFNRNMVITLVNSVVLKLLDCEPKDILGLTHTQAADLFSDNTGTSNSSNNLKTLDSFWPPGNCTVEVVNLRGASKKLSLTPYKLDEGYITVINDVGKEQEVDSWQEQQQMQQNKRLILLGQMAAGIVHEIRNPLTAVKGFSQIISCLAGDEKIKECSRLIDQETDSLNRVLTDFLRFARPRNPVMQETELNQIISSLEMIIESNAFLKKVKICFNYTKEDTKVMADAEQIKQVVLNLVQNSIDATGDVPEAWIGITTGSNKNINEVFVSVTDNGVGMTGEDIMKIGNPFYTTKEKGTGLGMNMCFQIIKEHGGSINIESKPNNGTTVTIYLPRFIRICQEIVGISA